MACQLAAQRNHIGNGRPTTIMPSGGTRTFFAGSDGIHGVELWRTDGKAAGTALVADIAQGSGKRKSVGSYPASITAFPPRRAFFTARTRATGRELYVTDGTSTGTRLVKDIAPGQTGSDPAELTLFGNTLFFTARTVNEGRELWWARNGKTASIDIRKGKPGSSPHDLTVLGTRLFFVARHATRGTELFVREANGQVRVIDIIPGAASSTPAELTVFGRWIYFVASRPDVGRELFKTNGTTLRLAADIRPRKPGSNPAQLTAGRTHLAFTAREPRNNSRQLHWISTTDTVTLLSKTAFGRNISSITAGFITARSTPVFWFTARETGTGVELWRTRTSGPAGVQRVHDIYPGTPSSRPTNLTPFKNGLLFRAMNASEGDELRHTDGTKLTLVHDIKRKVGPGNSPKSGCPGRLTRLGTNEFLFSAEGDDAGIELWWTNGTIARQVVAGNGMDPGIVQPQQHIVLEPGNLVIELSDALPLRDGLTMISLGVPKFPVTIRGLLRGTIMVDPANAFLVPFRTDKNGNFRLPLKLPRFAKTRPVAFGWQSLMRTGKDMEDLVASNNGTCTFGSATSQGGAKVSASGCANDDSGEYDIGVIAETAGSPGWCALVRLKPSGERVLLDPAEVDSGASTFEIAPGEAIHLHGFTDFFTPIDSDDPLDQADRLQLLLFDEPPSQSNLDTGQPVWQSYC